MSLESFLKLETEPPWAAAAGGADDERVQIVHKLLFDLLNAALRREAVSLHTSRAPRVAGGGGGGGGGGAARANVLPLGGWRALPEEPQVLQRMVEGACQQVVGWLVTAQQSEGMQIEVLLSCTLAHDAADIERGWQDLGTHKEAVIADLADRVLVQLIGELRDEPWMR